MKVLIGLVALSMTTVHASTTTSTTTISSSTTAEPPVITCQSLCNTVTGCRAQGSFCKVSSDGNSVCQGLNYRDIGRTVLCSANDPTCPQGIPVRCPGSTPPPISTITCENICAITPTCAFNPKSQGTYCRTEQTTPTCFGLFWSNPAQETIPCYFPADPTCLQIDPVRCG